MMYPNLEETLNSQVLNLIWFFSCEHSFKKLNYHELVYENDGVMQHCNIIELIKNLRK